MKSVSFLVSFLIIFNSVFINFSQFAYAAPAETRVIELESQLRVLLKEKTELEKKYFDAALDKTKLENQLLDYKDRFFESESDCSAQMLKEQASLREQIKLLEDDLSKARQRSVELVSEAGRMRRDLEDKENRLAAVQDESITQRDRLSKAEAEAAGMKKEIFEKRSELADLADQKLKLEQKIRDLEDKLSVSSENMVSQVSSARKSLDEKIAKLTDQLSDKTVQTQALNARLKETEAQLQSTSLKLADLTDNAERSQEKIARLEEDIRAGNKEINELNSQKNKAEKQYYDLQKEKTQVEHMLASLKEKYENLQASVSDALVKESAPLQNKIDRLSAQKEEYDSQVQLLSSQQQKLKAELVLKDSEIAGLKEEIRAGTSDGLARDKRFDDIRGRNKELEDKIASMTQLLNDAVSDSSAKETELENVRKELDIYQSRQKDTASELEFELSSKKSLSRDLKEKDALLQKEQEKYDDLMVKMKVLKDDYDALRHRVSSRQEQARLPLQKQIQELEIELENKEGTIKTLTQRLEDTARELGAKMDKVSRLSNSSDEIQARIDDLEEKLQTSQAEVSLLQQQKNTVEKKYYQAETANAAVEEKLQKLKTEYAGFRHENTAEYEEKIKVLTAQVEELQRIKDENVTKIISLQQELGRINESVAVREGLLSESDRTIGQNENTIGVLKQQIKEKEDENRDLMSKVIALNEELNSLAGDLSIQNADAARYKEQVFFLSQEHERLVNELNKQNEEKGSLSAALGSREEALAASRENEAALSKELGTLEDELMQMKTSLSRQVAMAKSPLQSRILELSAELNDHNSEIGSLQDEIAALDRRIEEKTRSVLRLRRKLYPYGEALGQGEREVDQRKETLAAIEQEKKMLEDKIAGVRADYKKIQKEFDDAKKEMIKKGLVYSRREDPLFETVKEPVGRVAEKMLETSQDKVQAISVKLAARQNELDSLVEKYEEAAKKYDEKKSTLARLKDENVLYGDALEQTKKEILEYENAVRQMTDKKLELKARLEALQTEADTATTELARLKSEHIEVESSLLDQVVQTRNLLNRKVEMLSGQFEEAQKRTLALESESEILKQHLQEKDIQIASLNNKIKLSQQQQQQKNEAIKNKEDQIVSAEKEYDQLRRDYAVLEERLRSQDIEKTELSNRIEVLKAEHDKFADLIKQTSGEKDYLTRELIQKTEVVTRLEEEQLSCAAEIDRLRQKLDSALSANREDVKVEEERFRANLSMVEKDLADSRGKETALNLKIADMEKELNQKQKELAHINIDLNESRTRLDQNKKSLKVRLDELELLRGQKGLLEKELFKSRLDSEEMQKQMDICLADNRKLKEKLEKRETAAGIQYNQRLETLNAQAAEREDKLRMVQAEKEVLEKDMDKIAKVVTDLRGELEAYSYKLSQADETAAVLKIENEQLQTVIASLNREIKQQMDMNESLRQELDTQKTKNIMMLKEQTQLSDMLKEGAGDKQQLVQDLLLKSQQHAQYEEKYNEAAVKLARAQADLKSLRKKTDEKTAKVKRDMQNRIDSLTSRLDEKKTAMDRLADRISLSAEKLGTGQTQLRLMERELKEAKDTLLRKDREIELKDKQIAQLSADLGKYDRTASDIEQENTALKAELAAAQKDRSMLKAAAKEELDKQRVPLENKITLLEGELEELKRVYDNLRVEAAEISSQMQYGGTGPLECAGSLEKSYIKQQKLQEEISALRSELDDLRSSRLENSVSGNTDISKEIYELKKEIKDRESRSAALQNELDYLQKQSLNKDREIAQYSLDIAAAKEETAAVKARLAEIEKERNTLDRTRSSDKFEGRRELEKEIYALKKQLEEKEETVALLYEHIEENKKIVDSMRKEMGLYTVKSKEQNVEFEKVQEEVTSMSTELEFLKKENKNLKNRNNDLADMVDKLQQSSEKITVVASGEEKDRIIAAQEAEIKALTQDQKELTEFLRKEVDARRASVTELKKKTEALETVKKEYRDLIDKIKSK